MFIHLGSIQQLIILALLIIVSIAIWVQRKVSKGKFKQNVQKPRQLKSFFTRTMMFLTIFSGVIAALGAITGELEMAIVFSVMFIIFGVLSYFMRRKFDMTYQETDDYFIFINKEEKYKVFYEDIVYWRWGINELYVLDGTRSDEKNVRIKFDYFHPEILLRTLAEMTFDDKFPRRDDDVYTEDPMKKKEMIQLLHWTDHKYLIKDEYTEETGELDGLQWPEQKNT